MGNLFGRLAARHRAFILALAWFTGGFQFLMCAVVAELHLESVLAQIMNFVPPVMRGALEQVLLGGSVPGVLAFGWDHPITHALLAAVAIALAARAVAGEVESGAIELVLAQPLGRAAYLGAHVLFALLALTLVVAAGGLGSVVGQRVFGLEVFTAARLLPLLLDLLLLQTSLYALTLLASVFGREAGRVAVTGVLVALVSYFLNVIATFWPKAHFLQPWSLYSYYDPRAFLVRGEVPVRALVVLAAVTVGATSLSCGRFHRRDLP